MTIANAPAAVRVNYALSGKRSGFKPAEATTDDFLQQRSDLILQKLVERTPAFAAFARRGNGMQGFALLADHCACCLVRGLDRITDPHRVDLLSAPLLLIIVWNLLVYLVMLLWL
jgi:hypothetical protein